MFLPHDFPLSTFSPPTCAHGRQAGANLLDTVMEVGFLGPTCDTAWCRTGTHQVATWAWLRAVKDAEVSTDDDEEKLQGSDLKKLEGLE